MILSVSLFFLVLAFGCFVVGAFWSPAKVNIVSLGLALLTLSILFGRNL